MPNASRVSRLLGYRFTRYQEPKVGSAAVPGFEVEAGRGVVYVEYAVHFNPQPLDAVTAQLHQYAEYLREWYDVRQTSATSLIVTDKEEQK